MALTQVTPDVVHNVQSNITQVGTLSNLTVSGNIAAHTTTSNLKAYGEIVSNVGGVSGTANIDLSTSNIFDITLTNSTTFTFINHPPAGVTRPVTIVLRQPAVGGKTASFTGALYTDGTAPVLSTNNNAIDVLSFWSINGGTTFFGTFAMANVS